MKEMIKKVREDKGGFTLAELLIVVAIILVLVAIAIPVFTGALGQAEDSVKKADIRSVKAAAATQILLDKETLTDPNEAWEATATVDKDGNIGTITYKQVATAGTDEAKAKNGDASKNGYDVTVYVTETTAAKG